MKASKFKIIFGKVIRERRLEMGYSQEAFAEVVGVHRTYQGAIERGERNISIENMLKIAEACETKLSALIIKTESS